MGPRLREDTGRGRICVRGGEGWVGAPRLRGGRVSTRGHGGGRSCSRGGGMGWRMREDTGRGRVLVRGGRDGLAPPAFAGAGFRREDTGGAGRGMDSSMSGGGGWGGGWVPAFARTTEGRDGEGFGEGREGWVGAPRLHGGRVSTRGHGGGRSCSRGGGMGWRMREDTGRGRVLVRGGRDGLAPPAFAGAGFRREDTGGAGRGMDSSMSGGGGWGGGWVPAFARTTEGRDGEGFGEGREGWVGAPRLHGGRVSTRGWRRKEGWVSACARTRRGDGFLHKRGQGTEAGLCSRGEGWVSACVFGRGGSPREGGGGKMGPRMREDTEGGCWFLCLLLAIVRFPRGGRGSRGLIYEGAMRLYACQ